MNIEETKKSKVVSRGGREMNLQESIIIAATEEFKEKGLKFTMDDITERLSISKKTIYTVFSSKEELLNAIVDYAFLAIRKTKQSILDQEMDLVEKIKKVTIALPDQYLEIDFRNLEGLEEKYPSAYGKVVDNLQSNWDSIFELLQEAVDGGFIKPINFLIFKEIISASIEHFISSDMLIRENIMYKDALQEMITMVMEGVLVHEN